LKSPLPDLTFLERCLGSRDPIVMLESTSADPYKLINALNAEFPKRGIRVEQY